MRYVKLALAWLAGALLLLAGLGLAVEDPAGGIIVAAIGALVFPPARHLTAKLTGWSLPNFARIILVAMLTVGLAAHIHRQDTREQAIADQRAAERLAEHEAQVRANSRQYFSEHAEELVERATAALDRDRPDEVVEILAPYEWIADSAVTSLLATARAVQDAQQREREREEAAMRRIKQQFSAWNGSHRNLERHIKLALDDPDSYEHAETRYWIMSDHLIVNTQFRASNRFGALVLTHVKARVSLDGQVEEIIESY